MNPEPENDWVHELLVDHLKSWWGVEGCEGTPEEVASGLLEEFHIEPSVIVRKHP